jgi:NAD(P)-dependent dehydrogenase (short-subunit alcohol dehydrogenase family)
MNGVGEDFTPKQFARILDTNAISWLRVNRASLPVMRRQNQGLVVYVSSTTVRLPEPFMAPYIASKAAGEALAESMSLELRPFGIESVIVVPGAFPEGTEHFAHANGPQSPAVIPQYRDIARISEGLASKLQEIVAANGGSPGVAAVGKAVRDVVAMKRGERPRRVHVDPQNKGVDQITG